jgi:hypothetical protein
LPKPAAPGAAIFPINFLASLFAIPVFFTGSILIDSKAPFYAKIPAASMTPSMKSSRRRGFPVLSLILPAVSLRQKITGAA